VLRRGFRGGCVGGKRKKRLQAFKLCSEGAGPDKHKKAGRAFKLYSVSMASANSAWGTFIPGIAEPDPSAPGGRDARKGGRYNAFVPPNIAAYPFS